MDKILNLLNFAPGLKTKLSAIGAIALAMISTWNTSLAEAGYGPCVADVVNAVVCQPDQPDLTLHVPALVNALLLALLAVGAANQPKNVKPPVP